MHGRKKQSNFTLYDKILVFLVFLSFCGLFIYPPKSRASTIAEEFTSNSQIEIGSLVSLMKDDPKQVETSSIAGNDYLLGVVAESNASSVTYAKGGSKVSVALSGEVKAFVSDANGIVAKGDFVGASWLEGVGMKSNTGDEHKLLGVALEDYDPASAQEYGEIDTPDGVKTISIDTINVRLFEKNSSEAAVTSSSGLEGLLSQIAGKNVSLAKIIACLVIFIMSVLVSGFFVSSSIRGSFISIGRNPLASSSIYHSLLHVTSVSVIIILIGTALSYVVLAA
jgi:hypothetical protein